MDSMRAVEGSLSVCVGSSVKVPKKLKVIFSNDKHKFRLICNVQQCRTVDGCQLKMIQQIHHGTV